MDALTRGITRHKKLVIAVFLVAMIISAVLVLGVRVNYDLTDYLPEDADESGEIEDMRLTVSVLSDGALAELYYRDKVFDIAESYDSDFRAALGALRYKGREMRLGAGRR